MTSPHNLAFKIADFVELNKGISLPNFIGLGCLGQILRRLMENNPSPDLHALKKPSPYRVKAVFVWEYTKTGKSILRPDFDQTNCKEVGTALILIERHVINSWTDLPLS